MSIRCDLIRFKYIQEVNGRGENEVADDIIKILAKELIESGFLRFSKEGSTMCAVLDVANDKLRVALACAFGDQLINPYGGKNPMDLSMKEIEMIGK
jgi:hypothetical protein